MNSSLLLLLLSLFSENEKAALIETVKKLKVQQDRDICRLIGLPMRGLKNDILNRLLQFIEARFIMRQYPELLALQTLVLKLLYNSPLPNYAQLVNAIRTGAISAGNIASLLEQFQMALNMATLTHMAQMAANGPINGNIENNVILGANGNYSMPSTAERVFMANQNSQIANLNGINSINGGLGNSAAQMHLNAMGRTIGGISGHLPHVNSMGHVVGMGGQVGGASMGRPGELENLYLGPMLLFKSTIFYLLRKLVGKPQVLRASKGRNIKSFSLKLNSSEVKLLKENPNMKLYIFSGTESTQDHTNTPIQFPPIEIYVDDALTKQHTKGIKGKPGSARPADLTPYFRLNQFERAILVRVVYSDALEKYIFYTYIVEEVPLEQLSEEIESKPHIPTSATRAAIQKENEAGGDDDEDIVVATSSLSLRCPLTYARIKQPVRSITCDHIQCFDGPSFLSMQQKIPLWQCPVCSAYIDQHSLAVSDYITEILKSTPDSVDSVILNPDGLWHAVEGETLLDSDDDDVPLKNVHAKSTKEESVAKDDPIEIISLDSDSEPEDNVTLESTAQQPQQPEQPQQPQQFQQPQQRPASSQSTALQASHPQQSLPADHIELPALESYIRPPSQPSSATSHVHSADVNISEPRAENNKNSKIPGDSEEEGTQRLPRLSLLQSSKDPLSNQKAPLLLMSDSPLSTLSATSAAEGPIPPLDSTNPIDSEDEDAVVAHPRRRAVITDASDTDTSRPTSAVPAENGASSKVQKMSSNKGDSSSAVELSNTVQTPITSQNVSSKSQAGPQTSEPEPQVSAGHLNHASEPFVAPQEALFMRTMRQFGQMPVNGNPFAQEQQGELNKGQVITGGTQQSSAISIDSATESPEPVVDNGSQYLIRPLQPQINDLPHLTGQNLALHRAIQSNMAMLSVSNQENMANIHVANAHAANTLAANSALVANIRNLNNTHIPNLGNAHLINAARGNQNYPGLPRIVSNGQILGNVYANPMYQQMVNESRAKISAYMQMGRENEARPDMMTFVSSVRPIPPNGNVLDQSLPARSHSASILNQQLESMLSSLSDANVANNANAANGKTGVNDANFAAQSGIGASWTTPKKRNNSVAGWPQPLEPTIASPNVEDHTKKGAKSQVQLDAFLNRSSREVSKNSSRGTEKEGAIEEEEGSMDIEEDMADSPNTSNDTYKTANRESLAEGSENEKNIGNKNITVSPTTSPALIAESGSNAEATTETHHDHHKPPPQLFVSPMGSAILDLCLTTPLGRKRPSADMSEVQRQLNKRVNQSPSVPITGSVQKTAPIHVSAPPKTGKAKFDPSTINQADIIELD